jgi:ABC-type sugar transport system ATPase subunit
MATYGHILLPKLTRRGVVVTVSLRCEGVSKWFGESKVLDSVGFSVEPGEIHALLGENGAGKSTLMKICSGLYRPDRGFVEVEGQKQAFGSVMDAQASGVALIHQEPRLFPDLNVMENIWIDFRGKSRGFSLKSVEKQTQDYLDELGCGVNLRERMADISIADQQLIDVASALRKDLKVLIVDEPTASLTPLEVDRLFAVLRRLKKQGVAIVFIGHRLSEILEISDRMTVLRDGQVVGSIRADQTTEDELASMMVGRNIDVADSEPYVSRGSKVLEVHNLSATGKFRDVSLEVGSGEIVGVGGLVGSGRSELLEAIFGVRKKSSGAVFINGVRIGNVLGSIKAGSGLVPEDRGRNGLVLKATLVENIVLPSLRTLSLFGVRRRKRELALAEKMISELGVRTSSFGLEAGALSGGNQQKLSLAKWLAHDLNLLLIDEPTRGVDIGSKSEIHTLIRKLAARGVGVLVVSSDMRELLSLPHRILVMREGELVGSLPASEATEETVIKLASGVKVA